MNDEFLQEFTNVLNNITEDNNEINNSESKYNQINMIIKVTKMLRQTTSLNDLINMEKQCLIHDFFLAKQQNSPSSNAIKNKNDELTSAYASLDCSFLINNFNDTKEIKRFIDKMKETTHISNYVFPVIKFLKSNSNHIGFLKRGAFISKGFEEFYSARQANLKRACELIEKRSSEIQNLSVEQNQKTRAYRR